MQRNVKVYDRRPELLRPGRDPFVTSFDVPDALTWDEILKRYGLADHLHVTIERAGEACKVIQHGRT